MNRQLALKAKSCCVYYMKANFFTVFVECGTAKRRKSSCNKKHTYESGFREQPPCRHPRSLNPDWSLNPDSFGSRKSPFQKSEASKSRPASKYQFSKYRLCSISVQSNGTARSSAVILPLSRVMQLTRTARVKSMLYKPVYEITSLNNEFC